MTANDRPSDHDRSVLQRVAAGEAAAVQDCIRQYSGLVWSIARRMLPNEADAEDAVQDIFLDVWQSSGRFDPAVASEATFVATIARRRLIDRQRKAGRRPEIRALPEAVAAQQPETTERAEIADEAARVAEAMERLRPEQQQVLKLAILEGWSHEQIAQSTGLPLGTVKTHARRGLIRMRELLAVSNRSTREVPS